MNFLFYEEWYKKRVQKIINIFGQDWFAGKNILELGACYGDIGIELTKLGAEVTFADARKENLDIIENKFRQWNLAPKLLLINQEEKYDLGVKFDLVLHLGVLYHIENWKQDLECALNHGDIMILETIVGSANIPDRQTKREKVSAAVQRYIGVNGKENIICQESIEAQFRKNNCKYIRFDNSELNTNISYDVNNVLIKHVYDWDYNISGKLDRMTKNNKHVDTHLRRFWLVVK